MEEINIMFLKLDGNEMTTKELFHDYFKKNLKLPNYYGKNLDALWDSLSTYSETLNITLFNKDQLLKHLGEYGLSIIKLLEDVASVNKNVNFDIK